MPHDKDKELNTYRNLIEQPTEFVDGFGIKTILGALFLGLLVTPGSLYIMLVAGEQVGPAARWVTIFLFAEVARRSFKELRQQEVFILYYMTSHIIIRQSGILWNIYMVNSEAFQAMGITQQVPHWVVPSQEVLAEFGRNMFTVEWLPAMGLIALTMIITRVDHFGLGYFLYRITSDVERLPFPMAPIGASGVLAMAETKDRSQQWRPACFAIGGVVGLMFGAVYFGVPAVTELIFREPVFIIPIPWIELTPSFQDSIPATAINVVPNLGMIILGMVLPFWAVVGGFIGFIVTLFLNPILYNGGILRTWFGLPVEGGVLHTWKPGMRTVDTLFVNNVDFYLSFTLGITFFIAFLGLAQAFWPILKQSIARRRRRRAVAGKKEELTAWQRLNRVDRARGDISAWLSLGIYIASTLTYLSVSAYLVNISGEGPFPWLFFIGYGFVYTPLMGYAAAKVEGMAGQHIGVPYIKEATIILSGYRGVAIWYAPIPRHNYAMTVKDFRIIELTGTKLTSVIKTDLVALPIMVLSVIGFSGIIWSQAPLNSSQYRYVQEVWDLMSRNHALIISSTLEGQRTMFFEALRGEYLAYGFFGAGGLYAVLSAFGLPVLLVFGMVRGLGQTNPAGLVPQFVGALLGRFYFRKKFGTMWLRYTPGLYAGYTCGVGLVGMIAVAIRLIASSIAPLPY